MQNDYSTTVPTGTAPSLTNNGNWTKRDAKLTQFKKRELASERRTRRSVKEYSPPTQQHLSSEPKTNVARWFS